MLYKRRLIAFICLVALLLAALAPATSSPHYGVLVPLDPLFGTVVIGQAPALALPDLYRSSVLEITGSRPPPAL